ncbi:MAG: hypothetical protein WC518_03210 [Patescibacteria group bacterium]
MINWIILNLAFLAGAVGLFLFLACMTTERISYDCGYLAARLVYNNNYRACGLVIVAIVFTAEAFFVGFGEGLFFSASRDIFHQLDKVFGYETPPSPANNCPSWWWWKAAFFTWPVAIVYLILSFREELADAIHNTLAGATKRGTVSGSAGGAGSATGAGSWTFWKDLKSELAGQGIVEILRKLLGRRMLP